jgi:putative inorganic carbon (HCO3(-)) transporter
VDRALTAAVLPHFVVCAGAFYLGRFALARVERMTVFWLGLCGGFAAVVLFGWRQHFGGLEQAREFFHQLPDWQSYPPELRRKLTSDRIFSTLFYPNALAGALLLLTPVCLGWLWEISERWPLPARWLAAGGIGTGSLACLYWSGSKAGWLIALGLALLAWWTTARTARDDAATPASVSALRGRGWIVLGLLAAGLAVFAIRNADYFRRGATSVVARFDYWQVAARTALREPVLGSGPGTFMAVYRRAKPPEAEMTRLAHNDYLQQASDSGLIGFLCYGVFLAGSILVLRRRVWRLASPLARGVWLGSTGLAVQGLVEFGLYIPALAWPQFFLLGWLWGVSAEEESNRLAPAVPLSSTAR